MANLQSITINGSTSDIPVLDNTLRVEGAAAESKTVGDTIAPVYSSSASYSVGDYVLRNGKFYKALVPISGENWTSAHWQQVTIGEELANRSGGGGSGECLEEITYAALKAKRDGGTLEPGKQYRITDYECTTTQDYTRAVSHPFDIIVVADDEFTLNENARACLHNGDTYYSDPYNYSKPEAWELKYSVDNNSDRFAWADAVNGKGVIYYMKDEKGNECSYDFKQIQFERCYISTMPQYFGYLEDKYAAPRGGAPMGVISDPTDSIWVYTFCCEVKEPDPSKGAHQVFDASILPLDGRDGCVCHNNIIRPCYISEEIKSADNNRLALNDIVFLVEFGDDCFHNTFGVNCSSMTFVGECVSNTFGDDCQICLFGEHCFDNKIGDLFYGSIFSEDVLYNRIGSYSQLINLADTCVHNTIGMGCGNITLNGNCLYNSVGDYCSFIDVQRGNNEGLSNYHVMDYTKGSVAQHLTVTGTEGNAFATYIGKNSSGVLKTWVPANQAP